MWFSIFIWFIIIIMGFIIFMQFIIIIMWFIISIIYLRKCIISIIWLIMWLIILIMWIIILIMCIIILIMWLIIIIIKIIVMSIHAKFIMEVSNTWNLLFACRMSVPFSFYSLLLPQPLSIFSTFSFRFSEILPHMRFFLFLIFLPKFSSIPNSSFLLS